MHRENEVKTVHIHFYGILREAAGREQDSIQTMAETPIELAEQLEDRYGLVVPVDSMKVAINDEYGSWEANLCDGDKVVFIPPVAGG